MAHRPGRHDRRPLSRCHEMLPTSPVCRGLPDRTCTGVELISTKHLNYLLHQVNTGVLCKPDWRNQSIGIQICASSWHLILSLRPRRVGRAEFFGPRLRQERSDVLRLWVRCHGFAIQPRWFVPFPSSEAAKAGTEASGGSFRSSPPAELGAWNRSSALAKPSGPACEPQPGIKREREGGGNDSRTVLQFEVRVVLATLCVAKFG